LFVVDTGASPVVAATPPVSREGVEPIGMVLLVEPLSRGAARGCIVERMASTGATGYTGLAPPTAVGAWATFLTSPAAALPV